MRKIVFLLAVFTSLLCEAQPQINRLAQFNLTEKLALQGYDPVAYFKGKAKMGKETLAVSYMGGTYYFS